MLYFVTINMLYNYPLFLVLLSLWPHAVDVLDLDISGGRSGGGNIILKIMLLVAPQ